MTQSLIKEQIETIRVATQQASQSKGAARKFLRDAGIIKPGKVETTRSSTASKKK